MSATAEEAAEGLENLGRALHEYDVACAIKHRMFPIPWRDFSRYCWRIYGTGRTEPDCQTITTGYRRVAIWRGLWVAATANLPMDWPAFNRLCRELYGTGRTDPDKPKEQQ